jgi:hypothetical protein
MIELTDKQTNWLDQQGGRNIDDVIADEKGKLYVLMRNGERASYDKVYLPLDDEI